jgi:hypothetical protein
MEEAMLAGKQDEMVNFYTDDCRVLPAGAPMLVGKDGIFLHVFLENYGPSDPVYTVYTVPAQNTTQKSISIAFCVSSIRHDSSLSKYRKQKQSPPWKILKTAHVQGGDCFCLRYLLSDES